MRNTYTPSISLEDHRLQVTAAQANDTTAPTFTNTDIPTDITNRTLGWVQRERALVDSGTNIHIITPAKVR